MKTFSLFKALTKICLKFNIGCISPNGTQECLECILTFLGDPRPPEQKEDRKFCPHFGRDVATFEVTFGVEEVVCQNFREMTKRQRLRAERFDV